MAIFYHLDRRVDCLNPGSIMTLRQLTATPETAEAVAYIHGLYPDGISNHGYIYACGHAAPGPERDRELILEDIRDIITRTILRGLRATLHANHWRMRGSSKRRGMR